MRKLDQIPTKSDFIYEEIKKDILSGKLKPKQRLVISSIAKEFGVSEIPVRDAISKLFGEGLIDYGTNNRAQVSGISTSDLKDVLEMRIILEPVCTQLAIENITDDQIEKLQSLINMMDKAIDEKKYIKYGELNREFHETLYSACPNKLLVSYIKDLLEKSNRARKVFDLQHKRGTDSNSEHKEILDAIRSGNRELAYRLMKTQKKITLDFFLNQLSDEKSDNQII